MFHSLMEKAYDMFTYLWVNCKNPFGKDFNYNSTNLNYAQFFSNPLDSSLHMN